jgi:beta-fructofuranosidase
VRHVLKLSDLAREDHYMVGRYDDAADTFVPAEPELGSDCRNWRRFDHGHLYASKSFYDAPKKRRVLWAWVDETDGGGVARGWAGLQAFPRAVWLDTDGKRLVQWPVEEIETLRRKRVGLQCATEVEAGGRKEIADIVSSQADVEVVFDIPNLEEAETLDPKWLLDPRGLCAAKGASVHGGVSPFELLAMASGDLEEHTAVFFRVFKHLDTSTRFSCAPTSHSK